MTLASNCKSARMPRRRQGASNDLVSIADVGVGVSQSLPVVVALRTARPGQLVYIEQPEIHLHPAHRSQWPGSSSMPLTVASVWLRNA